MATAAYGAEQNLSIGQVMSRTFAVMGDNPIVIFGIACLFGALPQQIYAYVIRQATASFSSGNIQYISAVGLGSIVVYLVLNMLVQGALVRATVAHSYDERASFGDCLTVGLSRAIPLIALSLLLVIGLALGFALFVIPGIMLYMMWSVTGPVLVTERDGIFAAFGRSRALTKGARWKIFGLFLVVWIVIMLLSGVVTAATVATGNTQALFGGQATNPSIIFMAFQVVIGTITNAFVNTVVTSLYISLRNWKDGPQAEMLADVFA